MQGKVEEIPTSSSPFQRSSSRFVLAMGVLLIFLGSWRITVVMALVVLLGAKLPTGFLPEEDQGYFYLEIQLPEAASLQRLDAVCREVEKILEKRPGSRSLTPSWVIASWHR
jgi:HAE1 family hydrophobic/amphiphilic exporter-1